MDRPMSLARRPMAARVGTSLVFLASGSGIGAWAAGVPSLKLRLSLSDSELGLALLAFAGGAIVAMPSAGWLGVRFGSHRVAVAAAAVFAAALTLPGLAGSLPVLVASALLLGMGNGVLDVSMNAHATAVERAWGSPIMSSFHAAFSLGGLTGAAAGGLLLGRGLAAPGVLALAAAFIGLLVLVSVALGAGPAVGRAEPGEASVTFAWPSRAQLGIGLLAFLTLLIEGAMADWSGVFLATVAGASVAAASGGYAAFSVAMLACRALGDRIVAWFGPVRVVQVGALVAGAGLTLALGVGRPAAGSLGFAMVGLGVANMIPVLFSAAGRSRTVAPAVGVASAATVGYAGFLLGPPAIGLAADLVGLRWALTLLLAATALIALAAARTLGRDRRPQVASRLAT